MKPFILNYAETTPLDIEPLHIEYSEELSLSVVKETYQAAINLATQYLGTFTKAGHEPTDHQVVSHSLSGATVTRSQETSDVRHKQLAGQLPRETHTLVSREATDISPHISRIAKRMSLETLTEARESTDTR